MRLLAAALFLYYTADAPANTVMNLRYFDRHAELAVSRKMGFIADTPTWRASRDWGAKLGYRETDLAEVNRQAIALLVELRRLFETEQRVDSSYRPWVGAKSDQW